jgi:hypothetical protein
MCGWAGNGILARVPIRPNSAWKAFGAGKLRCGVVSSSHVPKLWRERAAAIRALAEQMQDRVAKEALLHQSLRLTRRSNKFGRCL